MQHRGSRLLETPLDAARVLKAIENELLALGAKGVRIGELDVLADSIVVSDFKSPDYYLSAIRLSIDSTSEASRIGYEAEAKSKYPAQYLVWWSIPLLMVVVYSFTVSPFVVLALALFYALVRLVNHTFLPMWLEDLAYRVEERAKPSTRAGDA